MGITITNQDRNAIKTIYRKIKPHTDAQLLAALPNMPPQHPDTHKVMAAQNTLKTVLEVIINECVPYDEHFLLEIGTRLAAYAITAAPIESQAKLQELMIAYIPIMVESKLKQGAFLKTRWADGDQSDYPAVPEKTDVN